MKNILLILVLAFGFTVYGQHTPFSEDGPYKKQSAEKIDPNAGFDLDNNTQEPFQTPIDNWVLLLTAAGGLIGFYFLDKERRKTVNL